MKRVARYGRLGPVYELIPRPLYVLARNVWLDWCSLPLRLKPGAAPIPWVTLHNYGSSGAVFYETARADGAQMQQLLGIGAQTTVLDVGCGSGRLAWAMADILGPRGGYVGFDVSQAAIAFARKLMRRRRSDFTFHHVDLHSKEYNPSGAVRSDTFCFPCGDGWAGATIALSVFSHLLEKDAARFLTEIARTLAPEGRAFISAYVVDAEARRHLETGDAAQMMLPYGEGLWVGDRATPEAAVAYDSQKFHAMIAAASLTVDVHRPGSWARPGGRVNGQDSFVLRRAG